MKITPEGIESFNGRELEELFNHKLTENGDNTHISTGNILYDIFFQAEYFSTHLDEARIGDSDIEKVLAMFVRDPRNGYGYRDLGRVLMSAAGVSAENVVKCGRFDDLWKSPVGRGFDMKWVDYLLSEAKAGNNLAKKWMPHYVGKNKDGRVADSTLAASRMRNILGLNKQQYNKFVKVDTVERKLSEHRNGEIEFDKLPSNALIKYWTRFAVPTGGKKYDFSSDFADYLEKVRSGKKKMNFSTATVYDVYKNRDRINPDLAFDQIPKVSGNWIPVVDTSGSMYDANDSIGKALAVGHYLGKTSTYCPNQVVSFSSHPKLITLGSVIGTYPTSQYCREMLSMETGDCSNTDFGAVMELFGELQSEFPEFIIVLSDQEFDRGASFATKRVLKEWRENGVKTKMVWWNFNARNRTSADSVRSDEHGNLYISGYNPTLLRFLECGFSMKEFMANVLTEYSHKLGL